MFYTALYPHEEAKSTERRGSIQPLCTERGSVMHEDSGVVSWITDYKDRPRFVCVESCVLDRQQSGKELPQETVLLPTAPVKCVWVCTLWHCLIHTWETQNAEFMNSPSLACTLRPRYLKFWLNSPQAQSLNLSVVSLFNWALFDLLYSSFQYWQS